MLVRTVSNESIENRIDSHTGCLSPAPDFSNRQGKNQRFKLKRAHQDSCYCGWSHFLPVRRDRNSTVVRGR
jgi:hypothetical protein